jgi:glutathione S-transferase
MGKPHNLCQTRQHNIIWERFHTMRLVGMLDSPYVRRVAVSLQLLGLHFEHEPLSVFRNAKDFRQINPVVKAPTLVCDDGLALMDSTLILEYAEALAWPLTLVPHGLAGLQRDLRLTGLALAACEKSVQIVYERNLRPTEKQHEPWLIRVSAQVLAAYDALESELARAPLPLPEHAMQRAGVAVATSWHFTQQAVADMVPAARYPHLVEYSVQAERLPAFLAAPHGDGTYRTAEPHGRPYVPTPHRTGDQVQLPGGPAGTAEPTGLPTTVAD